MRKLRTVEMRRLSLEDFHQAEKLPLIVVLDDVRSLYNVGSVFRSCDAFRVEAIYLCGITATPPHAEIHKTALGAEDSVSWKYFPSAMEAIEDLRARDIYIYGVEQVEGSEKLQDLSPKQGQRYAVILGNEVKGVHQEVIDQCDGCLEIPQYGTKHSLNVSVTAGIIVWEFAKRYFSLINVVGGGIEGAVATFVGQNIGAKQYLRVRRGVHTGLVVGLGVSVVISVLMLTLGRFLVPLFISGTPEEVASATQTALAYLNTMSAFLSVLYVLYVYRSALQGMGNTLIPMVSGIAEFALRVAVVWTLPAIFGPNSIFFAEIAAWAGAAAILLSAYYVCVRALPHADAPLA